MSTIPVSRIVKVSVSKGATFPQRAGFGTLNIVGSSARIPIGERIRFYSDIAGVAADFVATDEEYKAATVAFSQRPRPATLAISRRFATAVSGELYCSLAYEKTLATWTAVTAGKFDVVIDGAVKNVSGINLSGATNMNGIAALIEAKLTIAAPGATCSFTGGRFVLRSGTTGTSSTIGFLTTPATGVDISLLMAGQPTQGGFITAGKALETISASLDAINDINKNWYGLAFTKEVTDTMAKDAMAWCEARVKTFWHSTADSSVLDAVTTTDIASYAKAQGFSRTWLQYDDDDSYPEISAAVRGFAVNFEGQNTTITLKFKQLPTVSPVKITESQRLALNAKFCNYYGTYGDSAMLAEGYMASGTFFDEIHGLDWLQNAIETNVFGTLLTAPTKIAQTDKGVAKLTQAAELALAQGVNNGLLAPGIWHGDDLGPIKTGDLLPKGYYVYAQSVDTQPLGDRAARKAPPIQVIAKGAGAIHFADVGVVFEA